MGMGAVLSALVFSSPTHLLISLTHESLPPPAPAISTPLPDLFPAFVFYDAGLWRGDSLESLLHAQKYVFHLIHISCSSHLIS